MSYREEFMMRAIELAQKGVGFVNPNPLVGCVLVRDGKVVAEGYHEYFGGAHAERNAVTHCLEKGLSPEGTEAYVTLEPCCHQGKQPPCTELLIQHKISTVYVGIADPNPLVAGHGIELLRQTGITVEVGFLQQRIIEQNKTFLTMMEKHRPYVLLKAAVTMDGKITTSTGDSKWVTGEEARRYVHHLRHQIMGIMVGIGTVLSDDPMLNCRLETDERVSQPYRIVADTEACIPLDSQLVLTAREVPLIVLHGEKADSRKLEQLRIAGVETHCCDTRNVGEMLAYLAKPTAARPAIDSILLEGGSRLNASFLKEGYVDEINLFVAPKIVGGQEALSPVGHMGIERMAEALPFQLKDTQVVGADVLLRYNAINQRQK